MSEQVAEATDTRVRFGQRANQTLDVATASAVLTELAETHPARFGEALSRALGVPVRERRGGR